MRQWVVFGFGNYLSDIFDIIHSNKETIKAIVRNIEPTQEQLENLKLRITLLGYEVPITDLGDFHPRKNERYCYGFITGRHKLVHSLKRSHNINFSSPIHKTAYLAANSSHGEGVCIGPHSIIGPNSHIGDFSVINRASSIGHDTVLREFSTISPGVAIAGMVKIGRNTFIGIGAAIADGISIGDDSIVGAGSVVLDDVPQGVVVVGAPAKILRKNERAE